ncbi:PTS galactitol transporter subunit IIC [Niallia circulans]|uniref:PTS galactitol transporter subunit IIC n=1 Tax=Niallia circulans TaxID=1397 RepID=UPI001F2E32BD|nr:PTS transporter subunit IIC [Niallia circulans]MCF2647816.1 PTS galactitol transporter subunit IIC [Niallia circulans]
MAVLDYIVNLGASVMMPIIFTIFALLLRVKIGKAIKSGLLVGVGFIGLNIVIALLTDNLGPAAEQMVENFGLNLHVLDVGWPAAAAIAFGSKVGVLIIPVCLVVNIVMLLTRTTQTVNIDIWNYWHFAFTGSIVAVLTDSFWWGIFAAIINMIVIMVIADLTAKSVEKHLGLEGVSLPHGFTASFVPIAIVVNKILDWIPGINKINLDADGLQRRLGVFGEPIFLGTIIGGILGLIAGYDVKGILNLAITMGAVLVLIPKMAAVLMEGLMPVSEATQDLIEKRFKNFGKLFIGLDSAVGIGHPTTLVVSLLLVPISLVLAAILPGNGLLPFASLAGLPFAFVLIVPITKGNVFRTFIVGLVITILGLWFATDLAPIFTNAASLVNFAIPNGSSLVSSIDYAASPLPWFIVKLLDIKVIGAIIIAVLTLALMLYNRRRILKEAKEQADNVEA